MIHSGWVSSKSTHITSFDAVVDDIAEQITLKKRYQCYDDGGFGSGCGPSFETINKRKQAKDKSAKDTLLKEADDLFECGSSPPKKRNATYLQEELTTEKKMLELETFDQKGPAASCHRCSMQEMKKNPLS